MSIEDDIAFLERVPTLALLGREAVRILAIGAESHYVHDGNVLFRAGDVADCGFVVQDGSFDLTMERGGASTKSVGPGTLLGETALITETRRPVTATAREPSTVVRIPRSLFLKMLEGYPDAASRLRDYVVAQAHETTRDITNVRGVLNAVGNKS
ncbi:MAG TPA: cyclic nucleotide-binding domain-containing protein [Xanthobacteraceae bacterium]|jgi:CRP-like cAMP-binding protein|nr:cyclic nucleotide-binding domain-containing protein [Xanthobacteraceae bacterium]